MKVSVIIPIYNVSDYVEVCLNSVLNQTYKNIECILVDDCGNDDSIAKCKKIAASYSGGIKITFLKHEKNRGLSAARNTGTEAASGEYIYYLDSDDYLFPRCIELMVQQVKLHPGVELVQGSTESRPRQGLYPDTFFHNIDYVNEKYWMRKLFFDPTKWFPVNAWNKLLNRKFLLDNNLFFKEGLVHEDELWMYWVVLRVEKVAVVHENTYCHIMTENSIMTTSTKERKALYLGIILMEILDNLQDPYSEYVLLKYFLLFVPFYDIKKNDNVYEIIYKSFVQNFKKRRFLCLNILLFLFKHFHLIIKGRVWERIFYITVTYYIKRLRN